MRAGAQSAALRDTVMLKRDTEENWIAANVFAG